LRDLFGLLRAALASAVMFLAGAIVPVLGGIIMIFAPAPVLGFSVGFPRALPRMFAVVGLTMGVIALTGGILAAVAYGLSFGLAAAVMCYMLERRKPFEMVVLCAAAMMLIAGTLAAFAAAGSPAALAQGLHVDLMTAMGRGEKFYHNLGIDGDLSADTRSSIVDTALRLSPALAAVFAATVVLANLGLFWRLSGRQQRLGYTLFGDLARWSTPEWLIWALLVSGFGLFIPAAPLSTIALNCFICVAAIYFCQGLAIMAFYFKVLSMPPLARGLIYFVTGVQPVLAALVCAAGIFDLWIDFRRLKPPSQEARNFGDFL
jgi:uncharacterized protein YybS (DUF2232 family)